MEPVGLVCERGEFIVIHECTGCGERRRNRADADDDVSALLG
jgi:RNHCP domain-containing protein